MVADAARESDYADLCDTFRAHCREVSPRRLDAWLVAGELAELINCPPIVGASLCVTPLGAPARVLRVPRPWTEFIAFRSGVGTPSGRTARVAGVGTRILVRRIGNSEMASAMHLRRGPSMLLEETHMVEAIRDQWAIAAAVVMLVVAAIVWVYVRR
jgi:hypothetical protein